MKEVEAFTDGACSGNPGLGGWGVVLRCEGSERELCGGENATTNNRMELLAAIEALSALKQPCIVRMTTDSTYVKDGITKWLQNWKKNGWKTAAKKPVANRDLWIQISELNEQLNVEWHWVKGHAGDPGNERADYLANLGVENV